MIWKKHKKYDNYEISNEGHVRNTITDRLLKPCMSKKGYPTVKLYSKGVPHTTHLHRLIAETFIEGEHDGMEVYHKNDNLLDNRVENLGYRTRSDMLRDGYSTGNRKPPRQTRVRVIETGEMFENICECARALGLDRTGISKCVNGVASSCGGLHFEKVE